MGQPLLSLGSGRSGRLLADNLQDGLDIRRAVVMYLPTFVTKLPAGIGTVSSGEDLVPLPRPPVLSIGRGVSFVDLPLQAAES
jgi:hypothetical protein